jgi:hypothetical protein
MFNDQPGVGMQILYRPTRRISIHSNSYYGADWLGIPDRKRVHLDNSFQLLYFERKHTSGISKAAVSVTADVGCEHGGGVSCTGREFPKQSFVGVMVYNRLWLRRNTAAITLGGGTIDNPGRYLVLIPPINGATAFSGTPYFTANPGDPFKGRDASATLALMPDDFTTFRIELNHRSANVPYFAGPGGITPPGGNTGLSGSAVPGFTPDLRKSETRMTLALLVRI